ncbi:tubulin polyglutamylase TTLL5 isoform X1 [Takifugu flavidus]|uniref:tubulin polyglutamylase TTLL5 isoform X1 n=1 Tax=Takifugu flavidus TaxID=433684 RepID=UPI0025444B89|nr:tubulin polyglutamylase TTLL5 isoform X1 [Takifugu flavidus]
MPAVIREKDGSESSPEDPQEDNPCIAWCGLSRSIPVLLFFPEAAVSKDGDISSTGDRYHMAFKIVRTESRLVRGILTNHGFHEVHPNSNDFNLMWSGSHLKPYMLRNLQDFQKVNHFPRSYELTRKDRLYKNIQRMQQTHGMKNFHIVPQTFVLPYEYQEFCSCFAKDRGPWIIKPVASSRGRGIYLVSNPTQISIDDNILVSRYIHNPLLIDEFKFDVRLYVLVTSYDPLLVYLYEEGLARFATVKYDRTSKNIKNTFMHLTNYSVNKKSGDYVSCDDPEVEDYGNKWSMSAVLRYLKQKGKDTTLLMRQVEDLIIKAILGAEQQIATACKTFVPHKTNCFELYGFDVLIDTNLKPWLLEVNLSPSLACDAPLDLKIKASMIADMFSLVGFVCQDPLSRQSRSERVTLDPSLKHPAAPRTQRPLSAPTATKHSPVRQRPASGSNPEKAGSKDKLALKQESTLGLTAEEIKMLRRIQEEHERRGGFIRIFPTAETWELYSGYLESKTSMNYTVANRLFHGRNANGNVQLQVESIHDCHVIQYERKLLSLETHKRRRRHLANRSVAGRGKSGKESKSSLTVSSSQEAEECAQEEREEVKEGLEPLSNRVLEAKLRKQMAASLERCHAEALSGSGAAVHAAMPKVGLLDILQQGWDLSKVQARKAFSSYLQRVQQRLLAESRTDTTPPWPDKDNDQMDLVIRFLKRAASNLQQDVQVAFPSRQLPLQDRRRILSHQLGEFIHCYDQETDNMVKKQVSDGGHCVHSSVFQEYITAASESELEEVLTFYTQKNKSSTIFLGTKVRSAKKELCEVNLSGNSETSKNSPAAKKYSGCAEPSFATRKISSEPDTEAAASRPAVRTLSEDQQEAATQPDIQAPQHRSSFPATLDFTTIHQHRRSSGSAALPQYCLLPPPPPQPPSYTQSMGAKSQLHHSESPPEPPGYISSSEVTQPPRAPWTPVSTGSSSLPRGQPNQVLRKIQSFTTSMSCGAASSIPGAMQIYSQKLSRPTSTSQLTKGSDSSKLKSNSVGTLKELHAGPEQAQSNQQAFISALQKLADKQAARRYASSSHINLLTHHLTQMSLANRMLSRDGFTLNPQVQHSAAPAAQRVRSGTQLCSSAGPQKDREDTPKSLLAALTPQQVYPPAPSSNQLQSAIRKLQQRRLRSQQFLDQSHRIQQAQFPEQSTPQVSAISSVCPSPSVHLGPSPSQVPSRLGPGVIPKPPSSAKDGQTRKTAAKRLMKSLLVPQAGPGPGGARPQMTRERAEASLSPLPARQVSLHVTASSQRCILGEDNIQR